MKQFARFILRKDLLFNLVSVARNDGIGGIDDVLGGAIVLLQLHDLELGIVLLEIEDVGDVGTSKGIDTLGIVSHYADILMRGS